MTRDEAFEIMAEMVQTGYNCLSVSNQTGRWETSGRERNSGREITVRTPEEWRALCEGKKAGNKP